MNRKGSALPLALLLVLIISLLAGSAFVLLGSERRVADQQEGQVDAYAIARSATDRFLANPAQYLPSFAPPAWTGPDSARIDMANGHAWVMVQRLRAPVSGDPAIYVVRSRGVRGRRMAPTLPFAERIFAQYAQWQPGSMSAPAAWTSLSGMHKNGGTGTISGVDACGMSAPVAGVAVPDVPGYVQSGGASVPDGAPPILSLGTAAQAAGAVPVDWDAIANGGALSPDVTIPGGAWPAFPAGAWPLIYVNQASEFSLPGDGRGLLVVRNGLRITGGRRWDGIILAGGAVNTNGSVRVQGAIISGLNMTLGIPVGPSDVVNGPSVLVYDGCAVANAAARFAGLAPLRNAGTDNWPSY